MKYLLDTNICIYIIKNKPQKVLEKFNNIRTDEIYISVITIAELQFGIEKSQNPVKNSYALNKFLFQLNIIPFDYNSTFSYGRIRNYLEKNGIVIGSLDMLIAAHAVCNKLILVTNNIKEFTRIPDLKVENWI